MFWIALVCAAWPMNTLAHYLNARETGRLHTAHQNGGGPLMWHPAYAEDLQKGDTFRYPDEPGDLAHTVSTPPGRHLDAWVRFCTHLKISDRPEGPSVVETNTPVLIWREPA